MTPHSKVISTMATCWWVWVAVAALGLTWGCGGVPSEVTLDDAAKAKIQDARDAQKKFMEKVASKTTKKRSGRLSDADLQPEPRRRDR